MFLNLITNIWQKVQILWSSSLCIFPHTQVTSSLLSPNILLSTMFSNTLN
jgi:hypothetical protein